VCTCSSPSPPVRTMPLWQLSRVRKSLAARDTITSPDEKLKRKVIAQTAIVQCVLLLAITTPISLYLVLESGYTIFEDVGIVMVMVSPLSMFGAVSVLWDIVQSSIQGASGPKQSRQTNDTIYLVSPCNNGLNVQVWKLTLMSLYHPFTQVAVTAVNDIVYSALFFEEGILVSPLPEQDALACSGREPLS
jgi:hypothetical protein